MSGHLNCSRLYVIKINLYINVFSDMVHYLLHIRPSFLCLILKIEACFFHIIIYFPLRWLIFRFFIKTLLTQKG